MNSIILGPRFRCGSLFIFISFSMISTAMATNEMASSKQRAEISDVEYFPTSFPKKAVTLVVHGLNVKPTAMHGLVEWLNLQGSDVYLINLMGHNTKSNIADVTAENWDRNMLNGYDTASKAARERSIPLYFIGYSLGALLGQDMMQFANREIHFEKQILIAPATAIRSRSHVLKVLFFLNEKKTLPSYTPEAYRANENLPLKIYKIMFQKEKEVCASQFTKLNIPTIVLIDPKDELISYRKLKRLQKKFSLTNYEIVTLDSDLKARGGQYHHLIIDEATMGDKNWQMVTARLKYFLF